MSNAIYKTLLSHHNLGLDIFLKTHKISGISF